MDAIVCMLAWVLVAMAFFIGLAYVEWREQIEKMLKERERRRAEWHFWWYEDGDKPLTSPKSRQYHQGRKGAL